MITKNSLKNLLKEMTITEFYENLQQIDEFDTLIWSLLLIKHFRKFESEENDYIEHTRIIQNDIKKNIPDYIRFIYASAKDGIHFYEYQFHYKNQIRDLIACLLCANKQKVTDDKIDEIINKWLDYDERLNREILESYRSEKK